MEPERARQAIERFFATRVHEFTRRQSAERLAAAFATAGRRRSLVDPLQLHARRQQLTQRYSASRLRPPSPERVCEPPLVAKTASLHVSDQALELEDDSSSSSGEDQVATVEIVVQRLHEQLESLRTDALAKQRRIDELEALVCRLELENQRLRKRICLQSTTIHGSDVDTSNQVCY